MLVLVSLQTPFQSMCMLYKSAICSTLTSTNLDWWVITAHIMCVYIYIYIFIACAHTDIHTHIQTKEKHSSFLGHFYPPMNLAATRAMWLVVSQTHVTFHFDRRGQHDKWLSQSGIWGLLKVTAKGHKSRSGACQRNWLCECLHVYKKVKVWWDDSQDEMEQILRFVY